MSVGAGTHLSLSRKRATTDTATHGPSLCREVRPTKLPMQPCPGLSIREAISATGWPGCSLLTSETALALCDFEKLSVTLIFFNRSEPLNWLRRSRIPRGPVWLQSVQYMLEDINSSLKQPQHLPNSEAGRICQSHCACVTSAGSGSQHAHIYSFLMSCVHSQGPPIDLTMHQCDKMLDLSLTFGSLQAAGGLVG